jgi:hypothetical protein
VLAGNGELKAVFESFDEWTFGCRGSVGAMKPEKG